ncbi:MAG: porin family protein [Thermoanaerobaculia bacterium]|nr:porin family protein [Thermoanaerobaculia bacterium]
MVLSRRTLLAFAAALVLVAARPARAQFSLGGHASYTKAGEADGTWYGGAQLRLRFLGPLGVEGLIDYRRATYGAGGEDVLRIEQYPVQASLMLFILSGQVQPYVLGGGGWYYTKSTFLGAQSALGSDTQHTFGGHVGGGVELGAKAKVSLHVDIRYVFLGVDSIDTIRDRYDNNPKADFWHGTAGLNFKF